MFLIIILSLLSLTLCQSQREWTYACDSLICDPPKMCIVQEQVAQCLLVLAPTQGPAGVNTPATPIPQNIFAGPTFTQAPGPLPTSLLSIVTTQPFKPSQFNGTPTPILSKESTIDSTTTPSPFAPFLNLFGTAAPLTLPTLAPPSSTTTKPKVDICQLPPLTGTCSRARIMWYYDTETGKCERFSYSGCGNDNRFASRLQCEQTCANK